MAWWTQNAWFNLPIARKPGTCDLQRNTVSIDTVPLSLKGYREWQQQALTSTQHSVSAAPPPPPPPATNIPLGKKNKTGVKEHRGAEEKFVVPTTPPPPPPNRRPNSADLADLFRRFVGFLNFADLFCRFFGFLPIRSADLLGLLGL